MADTIERLEVLIEANTKSFENAINKLAGATRTGLKPVGQAARDASVQMERLNKGAEFLGKAFGFGLAAAEVRKLAGDFIDLVHKAATGSSDVSRFVRADMIGPLQDLDNLIQGVKDKFTGLVLEAGAGVGLWFNGLKDPFAGSANRFDDAGKPGMTLDKKAELAKEQLVADAEARNRSADAAKEAADAFNAQNKALEEQLFDLKATDREAATYAQIMKLGKNATVEQRLAIYDHAAALFDQKKALEENRAAANLFAESMYDAFSGIASGSETAAQALEKLIQQLLQAVLQAELLGTGPLAGLLGTAPSQAGAPAGLLGQIGSALVGSLPHFASGGDLGAGRIGLVGENGPELIRGPANITPLRGANDNAVNININVSGARGNMEIRQMVAQGVTIGIQENEKRRSRAQMLGAA